MRFQSVFVCLFAVVSLSAQQNVPSYISSETPIAKAGILANIGSNGAKSQGAKPGIVIASPSATNPNYLFTWTRDSSLVFKALIDQYVSGQDNSLLGLINDFVTSQAIIQGISNPSGSITTGGLGEPKFNIGETAFTDPWGRPQRDGPALRATALTTFANYLILQGNMTFVTQTLWPIIQNDLNYVQNNWNFSTFDLWEEVNSASFFTTAVQHRALREGSTLATTIGQTGVVSGYNTQAGNLLCFLQSYWNPSRTFITANTGGGRSGIDANTLLAVLNLAAKFDANAGCDDVTFQPCSDKALANHKVYVDSFRSIYAINSGLASTSAVATGRYQEDGYMGGNPWYITTLAAAEQLYLAVYTWKQQGSLTVTSISQPFFAQFSPGIAAGTYTSTSSTFNSFISAISNYADGFVAIVAQYTPSNGGLAEQFSRSNGTPVSAVDLTWSYAAALTAFQARAGVVSPSWGANGLTTSCSSSGGSETTVATTFNVEATTVFGENIYITGSIDALQNWSPDNAFILSAADYPIWSITVNLPASTRIEYKYIRKFNGAITWESDPNMVITTPSGGSWIQNDVWR